MKNNLNLILPLLRFDLGSYHVQILQRSKDGHQKATKLVAEWFVSSEEKLLFIMDAIVLVCATYNARAYINLNPKSDKAVGWKIAKSMLERLETNASNPISILSHAHDSCQGNEVKYWVIDIDDPEVDLYQLAKVVNTCKSGFDYINVVACIPSKSGFHLITVPFDMSMLKLPKEIAEAIEIKKNASTILYCL